ncbi:hypothetical protein K490DRAFT_69256 [Saccharata proteae CBS 121410]|uniref:Uncharacterized protein n=1 Tax=Saccharata proteae CBS 121410 TaxID=1314787 RepID=A0A9P4HPD0_9PEZI|nr:hypothetical protein K490DRAFT_69256 [Saccharata proteae CBS 121410]
MLLPRPAALRVASQLARPTRTLRSSGVQRWQRIAQTGARRSYASATGETAKKASGDMPWLIGSIAFTVPALWYLLRPGESSHHGHAEHHEEHHEEKEEEPQEEPQEESKEEIKEESKDESKDDSQDEPKSQEKGKISETEGKEQVNQSGDRKEMEKPQNQGTPEGEAPTKDEEHVVDTPEHKGSVEGVRFKGSTNQGGDDHSAPDTRKHIPDAKGGSKKRIESGYGVPIGADDATRDASGSAKDNPATSKPDLDQNQMSGKQAGLSNTDTKHSTDVASNPEKSKKGEGSVETAKTKGTVSPDRPAAEDEEDS